MEENIQEFMHNIVKQAYHLEVTDIHFQPNKKSIDILYRQKLSLIFQKKIEWEYYEKILRYIKFKTKLDISIRNKPQDGSYEEKFHDEIVYIRTSMIPLIDIESMVLRILPSNMYQEYEKLFFNINDFNKIRDICLNKRGLLIFTGPTGSGKTTAMYSILNKIAEHKKKIITIENPIEIMSSNFVQLQINEDLNITFSQGLKSALRHDPDIIMIGEIRDEETAKNVIRATLTGHTIITTMHTKNKRGVIERFLDFGFKKSEIESILECISSQRLIIDKEEKIKIYMDVATNEEIKKLFDFDFKEITIEEKIKKEINQKKDNR